MQHFITGRKGHPGSLVVLAAVAAALAGGLVLGGCQAGGAAGETGSGGPPDSQILDTITVNGLGRLLAAPDEAVITVTVENDATDAARALDENSKRTKAVIEGLKTAGVTEDVIETANVTVFPNRVYDPDTGKETLTGYRARNSVRVTLTDMALVGAVFAAAAESGASSVDGPEWKLAEDGEAVKRALERAVENARTKAETLAGAAGVRVGDLLVLSEASASAPPIMYDRSVGAEKAGEVTPPPISPQDLEVTATVTATYRLER